MRDPFEANVMLVVTGLTNFAMFPTVLLLHRQNRPFEAFLGLFTMITSFMYHCADSVDHPLWLTEGQWHVLDNMGSISGFMCWAIYLMDIKSDEITHYLYYGSFGLVILLQTKSPWDERFSFYPVLVMFASMIIKTRLLDSKPPAYDMKYIKLGLCSLVIALLFFAKGLDDDHDPFRIFHGCWHLSIGVASYFNWKVLPPRTFRGRYLDAKSGGRAGALDSHQIHATKKV